MSIELAKAYVQIVPSTQGLGNSISEALGDAGDKAGEEGGKRAGGKFASALGVAAKAAGAALAAAGTAVGSVVKSATQGFAEYEQLVGGLQTMFEDLSWDVEQNANRAFQTAGLSANEYMETVMGFSAALNQSLIANEGNISRAADLSDQIITDMADNANKMGTSMESIQTAYSGFAKQNYTMLDNLKLGYGGTKEEMERLLADAEEMAGLEVGTFDVSNFADIAEAIHIVQENMGIAGATALEASTTISGSLSSMKGAWDNLLVGMADGSADIEPLIDNLVESAMTFGENLVPVLEQALQGVGTVITGLAPVIVDMLPGLVETILPSLLESAGSIIESLVAVLPGLIQTIVSALIPMLPLFINAGLELFVGLIGALPQIISTIVAALPSIISGITDGLLANLPALIMAGVELFTSLITNLPTIIATIVAALPEIITGIVNGIVAAAPQMVEAGYNMFVGLKDGIINAAQAVWSAVTDAINGIIDGAKRLLGIASPSKVFREIGGFTMQGFAEGIIRNEGLVKDAMQEASALASGTFSSTLAISANAQPAQQQNVARELADALRNVRVYLDGNKTVGYLVPGIDNALGVRQAAAIRGAI